MNLAYFRKSKFDFNKTLENLKDKAKDLGLDLLGEVEISSGKIVQLCAKDWLSNLVSSQKELFAILPCSFLVFKKDDEVFVGVSDPSLLGKLSYDPSVQEISTKADSTLKKLVNDACGVEPLKVKKVRLYATTSCPYCKMEASFLDQNKVDYDYVLVDLDRDAAQEMVQKTGQMGVPVTEIVYENGDEEYIIGFDRSKLSQILLIKN
ncbi:MAG: Glutaredoxin [Candidatus Woesebacteria bacterium]|nr:MAG: Glutaredoxin [Candidatus Woesebacteria bacterium]